MKKFNLSCLLLMCLWHSGLVFSGQRIALVIGNGDYLIASGKLSNPPRDARAIAEQLERLGFDVLLKTNVTNKEAMETAVDQFAEHLTGKDIGLFYYAGHGLQIQGHNYLVPVKAGIKKAKQVRHKAMNASYLLDQMAAYKPKLSIVILDACRDNPFPKEARSGSSRGLGRMQAPSDMLISFATEPGATADDGEGMHSPYTDMLLRYLQFAPQLPIQTLFNRVGVAVETKTNHNQSPRLEMSPLHYNFCFSTCADNIAKPETIPDNKLNNIKYSDNKDSYIVVFIGFVLLAVFLLYGLYYRKQLLLNAAEDNAMTEIYLAEKPYTFLNKYTKKEPDLSACQPGAFAYLCSADQAKAIGEIAKDTPTRLGRSSHSSIRLKNRAVSAHHAEISWDPVDETFILQDNGSTNGTWIHKQQPLVQYTKVAIQRGTIFYLGHKKEAYFIC